MWDEQQFEEHRQRQSDRARVHFQTSGPAFVVPLAQSAISGLLLGLCAGTLTWALKWGNPFIVFLVVTVLGMCAWWFLSLLRWRELVDHVEGVFQVDLNRDGQIAGDPGKVVRIEVLENGGRQMTIADLPVEERKLIDLSTGLLSGQSFSESAWSGPGALFSRAEFRALRDEFMRRGWLAWRNPEAPGQGVTLTHSGKAVVRTFASMSQSPSPTLARDSSQTG